MRSLLPINLKRKSVCICVAMLCVACHAQEPANFHSYLLDAGVSLDHIGNEDGRYLAGGNGLSWGALHVGGGFALTTKPVQTYKHGEAQPMRHVSLYLIANFMAAQSKFTQQAFENAVAANPQNIALLSATSAKAKFYSTTLDPTLRYAAGKGVSLYVLGGFGWLRRTTDFSGASAEGALLQPTSPSVFGPATDSGAVEVGGGVDWVVKGLKGVKTYAEVRALHGLTINSATTLFPITFGVRW